MIDFRLRSALPGFIPATTARTQADFRRLLTLIGREPVVVDLGQLSD